MKNPADSNQTPGHEQTHPDRPWLIRTYSGHSSAQASNALYRENLSKGQTGLSVAFDLPTQTGYDSDHPLARGEVGKVGVPIAHLGDMRTLFKDIPLEQMNTSMTINAPAAWLLALYIALAEEQGIAREQLSGTVQNDIIKEYLSRGTYIFPPQPSLRLINDVAAFTYREIPRWNPINICSYHLQEAGATPVQELAFALATATAVLDSIRDSGQVPEADFPRVVGRVSFFLNAGLRFVTELCKMRAFVALWDEITQQRYGVTDPKLRRFRYGVQVNSLGLTEQQPENNVYRILIEMLSVVLSKDARARSVQLPAWNEALGLPRPWDQQWSLRLQQIMAYETDLLEYQDIFNGSAVIDAKVETLMAEARNELRRIEEMGGTVAAVESAYMKQQLVNANAARMGNIESGEQTVVGVNRYQESEPSPLQSSDGRAILQVDPNAERDQIERLQAWRRQRDHGAVERALQALEAAAAGGQNIMEPSVAAAHAGVTTGEWTDALRKVFGEYRAPTGIGNQSSAAHTASGESLQELRAAVSQAMAQLGHRPRLLVGKPGLDGHSNGAEQIAVKARDAGFDVVYEGIRLTPQQIVNAAMEENVDLIGLSILSGSHIALVTDVLEQLQQWRLETPVIVGGIIPPGDAATLKAAGVAQIYTPKDYQINEILLDLTRLITPAAS